MRAGSLFSGCGALDLAVEQVFGSSTAWHVETDPAAARVLAARWPGVPNLGDITSVDWATVDPVELLSGGFPCQDLSTAGARAGLRPGTRSGLWSHFAYAISQLRPRFVIIENVRGLLSARADGVVEPCPWCVGDRADDCLRALGAVLADLAVLGYDAVWCGLRASDVGAPHERFRVFIAAADTDSVGPRPESAGFLGGSDAAVGGGASAPHPDGGRRRRDTGGSGWGPVGGDAVDRYRPGGAEAASDANGEGWEGPEPARRRDVPARRPVADACGGRRGPGVDNLQPREPDPAWGMYGPAVRRWERALGRPAPVPTVTGKRGAQVLNPELPEWMMGLPEGWVTGVEGLSRTEMLRCLGNGVVPQQAAAALRYLLPLLGSVGERAA